MSGAGFPTQVCYCGTRMVSLQTCKYRCPNCGIVWDCADVLGLPK